MEKKNMEIAEKIYKALKNILDIQNQAVLNDVKIIFDFMKFISVPEEDATFDFRELKKDVGQYDVKWRLNNTNDENDKKFLLDCEIEMYKNYENILSAIKNNSDIKDLRNKTEAYIEECELYMDLYELNFIVEQKFQSNLYKIDDYQKYRKVISFLDLKTANNYCSFLSECSKQRNNETQYFEFIFALSRVLWEYKYLNSVLRIWNRCNDNKKMKKEICKNIKKDFAEYNNKKDFDLINTLMKKDEILRRIYTNIMPSKERQIELQEYEDCLMEGMLK